MAKETQGKITWHTSNLSKPIETWYNILGDLSSNQTPPIIVIHGGPGATHEYMLPVSVYADQGHPVIFYDQLGNGNSTKVPEKLHDKEFWNVELFLTELDELINGLKLREKGYHLLGQSWGAMLAAQYAATRQPKGLVKLILAGGPSDCDLHLQGVDALVKKLPQETQEVIAHGIASHNFESEEYQNAEDVFFQKHLALGRPWPTKEVQSVVESMLLGDTTVRLAMWGPSELTITGALKHWSLIPELHKINVPTLVINGRHDEVQDITVKPFFDHIPRVKWVTLENSAHFTHADEPERFNELVLQFLEAP